MAPSCRLDTLKKKASQLSTLCGVDVCFLCFSPDGGVLTWPEKEPEVRAILSRYTHQSKKHPLCRDATAPPPAKKRKGTSPAPRNAQSDDLLGLLNAKLSILNEKIQGLERKNGDSWMDLDPSVRVCDSEIWRELEGIELGEKKGWDLEGIEFGEEGMGFGECSLSPEEIESWVSALAAEGEMDQSNLRSTALTLNEQIGDFEKNNGASESPLCAQVEQSYLVLNEEIRDLVDASENRLCEEEEKWMNYDRELEGIELGSVGEEGEHSLSLDEIESWVSALAPEGEMATQSPSSDLPNSVLSLNEQTGYFEKKNESPLCVQVEQGLIFNEKRKADSLCAQVEQAYLVDASENRLCEEEKWMNSDSQLGMELGELGDAQFWGDEQLWEFGEARPTTSWRRRD